MERRGFTLIELLVFVGVFSAVIVGFITILVTVTRVQSRESSATEVESQAQFLLQQIQYYVETARIVDMPLDTATGTLALRQTAASSSFDPTYMTLTTGRVYLQQGVGGALQALTSNKVTVSNLSFTRHYNLNSSSSAYGIDSVSYSFIMVGGASNTTQFYSQSFESSAAVLSPVPKIALVQKASAATSASSVTSISATYPTSNDTSSILIAVISNTGGSSVSVSLADSAGNTWTKIANPQYAAYSQEITIFDALNAKNSPNTVTTTFGSGGVTNPSLFIYEYRGASTSSSFDASSTQLVSATSSPSSGSANPTSSVELILGALYSNPSTENPATGSGFATETTSSISATYVEDQDLYVTGSVSANWTYSATTPSSSATVVTFK